MRIFKSHPLLKLVNSYVIDSPQPSNISFLWNFGSLLAFCLVIQIITGVTLAMHYNASVLEAFNSVEHIMRDVNNGWLIRYLHSNTASAFFFIVYLHIGRGLYYGSYKAPRTLVWTIGTVIFILMMAIKNLWPNWMLISHVNKINMHKISRSFIFPACYIIFYEIYSSIIKKQEKKINISNFSKARTKALYRIGPHNKDVLSILVCGLLGDWWADKIKGQISPSIRFNIEQAINNAAYIHHLTLLFNELGYCSNITPSLVKKSNAIVDNRTDKTTARFNYRLSLFTFTSFVWIYDSFYHKNSNGVNVKRVPCWIGEYITPAGLAHWIMQDGSRQIKQGISLATNSFTYEECKMLCEILNNKFSLKCSVVKTGTTDEWRISIWKQSMASLVTIVKPYIIKEMNYKFIGYKF